MSDPDFIGETNETSSVNGTGILADCGADSDESDMWSCNKLLFEALGLRENHAQVALFSRHLTLIVQINTYGVFNLSEDLR